MKLQKLILAEKRRSEIIFYYYIENKVFILLKDYRILHIPPVAIED